MYGLFSSAVALCLAATFASASDNIGPAKSDDTPLLARFGLKSMAIL